MQRSLVCAPTNQWGPARIRRSLAAGLAFGTERAGQTTTLTLSFSFSVELVPQDRVLLVLDGFSGSDWSGPAARGAVRAGVAQYAPAVALPRTRPSHEVRMPTKSRKHRSSTPHPPRLMPIAGCPTRLSQAW